MWAALRRTVKTPKDRNLQNQVSVVEYLQRVDILKDLAREDIDLLFKDVTLRQCVKGTVFFTPDDPNDRLFILKTGQVDIYRLTAQGKRLVTQRIGPGRVFGDMDLLGQTLRGCFAEATEESMVCIATRDDVLQALRQRPDVALRMLETVGSRLKTLEERLEQALFSPVSVRLASFLLANMNAATGLVDGFTHEEIGDTIGAMRPTVTATLKDMERRGLVRVEHKRIVIANRPGLKLLALDEGSSPE